MDKNIEYIEKEVLFFRKQLQEHKLYKAIKSLSDIKIFMEYHVFAVWDFMSLLKSLQIELTTVSLPWYPSDNPVLSRFINEIVYGEESDVNEVGDPKSHFEMYLDAMEQLGISTSIIKGFINEIKTESSVIRALENNLIDPSVVNFVKFSFGVIDSKEVHKIASVFTFGREDLIPDMFIEILKQIDSDNTQYTKLRYYLDRHIELDGDEHGPLSLLMVSELCGEDLQKWEEALDVAKEALQARIIFWDAIYEKITSNSVV